ncbi:hypothetical protein DCCM_4800 [Desulfocucumis palustris]|uniref:Uncharacterized protein n=1 Tax=Desulfocucumis palustris TaxID=1898651 RepID=A0A2L2XNX2_9FIRM|nr:hypothetical protein DCCM_4800 [Desulfocucumis palustris]
MFFLYFIKVFSCQQGTNTVRSTGGNIFSRPGKSLLKICTLFPAAPGRKQLLG